MIKAIIFDLFGVIISDGLKVVTAELDKTKPGARQMINHYVRLANSGQIPPGEYGKEVSRRLNITVDEWRSRIVAGEHKDSRVIDYIKATRKVYKTALLSNIASRESMNRRLSEEELNELFDVVVISGEVRVQKPEPEIFKMVVERLEVEPSECVFIDDSPGYCQAAEMLGIKSICYKDFDQMKTDLSNLLNGHA